MPVMLSRTLSALRLTAITQALMDTRQIPQTLLFLNRLPIVPAADDEIMARFAGSVQIADLVADDAKAGVYEAGQFVPISGATPNIKHGIHLTQGQLERMRRFEAMPVDRDDSGYTDWETAFMNRLRIGTLQRMEALAVAMAVDGLSYDRLGIKMSGVTWGMPAQLKVTAGTPWQANPSTATPVSDIATQRLIARVVYGAEYNRLTMSTPAFTAMINTTEFQTKSKLYLAENISFANLVLADQVQQRALAERVLGLTIELYDQRYSQKQPDGSTITAPYLAPNLLVLSNSASDNNEMDMDFGNAIVTESTVASMAGGVIGDFGGEVYGPASYATVPFDLNPPSITMWSVARGFPRKHNPAATAVLDVGTITDLIPQAAPQL